MRRFLPGLLSMLFVFPLGSLEAETWHRPSNSFQFRLGGFFPEGGGDFWADNEQTFTLDHSDFNGAILGLTYVASVNNHIPIHFLWRRATMKSLANSVKRFLVSEDGPTAVEYAVMLALIIVVCLTAIQAVGNNANTKFGEVRDALT